MDRLDAMQVLLAVVDEGSLSAGSRKLGAPLPSVSRKVAELERHLGTRLLIRTSRSVKVTDAGRAYIEATREIIEQVHQAEQFASGEYAVPRGELKLTLAGDFGRLVVLPLAIEFLSSHSEITLNITTTKRVVDLVEEGVDVAVRIGVLETDWLYAIKVGVIPLLTCASSDYFNRMGRPEKPEDLADHDGVQLDVLPQPWSFLRGGQQYDGRPRVRVRSDDAATVCAAAISGAGIARLPSYMVADDIRSGALVRIFEEYTSNSRPVHLVFARQGMLPVKVRAFLDWMAPRLRQKLEDLGRSDRDVTERLVPPPQATS